MNAQDEYGLTALHCAADRGNYPAVLELIKIDAVQVDIRDKQGETALHMAIMYEDIPCIRKLLYNKYHPSNPRIYSYTSMSPLHIASREASLEIVELVFDRVKNLQLKESLDSILRDANEESKRVKQLCAAIGVTSIIGYNKAIPSLLKTLYRQAKREDLENYPAVKRIIDAKFDKAVKDTQLQMKEHINRAGEEKMTCLHLACKDGRSDVVQFLVSSSCSSCS